jgi:hypothetical protein
MQKIPRSISLISIRLSLVYVLALVTNYVWEMLQMPLYEGMRFDDLSSYLNCLRAAFGDANISLAIFVLGRFLFGKWNWSQKLTFLKALYSGIIGAGIAIGIERQALVASRWTYTGLMLVIPRIEVGLVPVLQLMILPYLAFVISHKLSDRGRT